MGLLGIASAAPVEGDNDGGVLFRNVLLVLPVVLLSVPDQPITQLADRTNGRVLNVAHLGQSQHLAVVAL